MVKAAAQGLSGGLTASGRGSEKISLLALQSEMKCDPEGYQEELDRVYGRFRSSLDLFRQTATLSRLSGGNEPAVAKELGDLCMFLAHVMPFYPERLDGFPCEIAELLRVNAESLPGALRLQIAKALMLMGNRGMVDIGETVSVFMELQTLRHSALRKLAFSHVVHSIRRMNGKQRKKDNKLNPQDIIISMLKDEDESRARRSLRVLCDLHRRRVWFDDKTANAICEACFHPSSRVMKDALSFLLGYERMEDYDSDESGSEDESTPQKPTTVISKEDVYKAHHKGTLASKKKKKAKLERVMRSLKRQQRISSQNTGPNSYTPLSRLRDAQGFAEKLFSHLQSCNGLFEVRMMMLKVVARTIGLHCLILLNFYPYVQKYTQPHQKDVTSLLAAAVQACHHMVPPDAVESLFRQIVNQFIHDRSRPEAIAVGLNVVKEICLRIPLLMTEELLQDLVLYKNSHEKAISSAARSLMALFRQICPALLSRKDRGRPSDPKARPKAFGEVNVGSEVPGADLLLEYQKRSEFGDASDVDENGFEIDSEANDDPYEEDEEENLNSEEDMEAKMVEEDSAGDDDDADEQEESEDDNPDYENEFDDSDSFEVNADNNDHNENQECRAQKRKVPEQNSQVDTDKSSLGALRRLVSMKMENTESAPSDGILSNEEFQLIKKLKAENEAKVAMVAHGLSRNRPDTKMPKLPNAEDLHERRVDPAKLEVHIRRRLSKEERLAAVKAGREDRGKYQARAAVKQKKTGGLSNRQKEHKKAMPLAAKRAKVVRSRQDKKKRQQHAGKQFRGRKAWK